MIKVYPVKFEAYDDASESLLFSIEAFDGYTATVTISSLVDIETWDEVSAKIRGCLVQMRLGDDK